MSLSSVRPQMVTWAPSAAKRVAVPSPIPLPPPVTRVVLAVIPLMISTTIGQGDRPGDRPLDTMFGGRSGRFHRRHRNRPGGGWRGDGRTAAITPGAGGGAGGVGR